jgi:hypothetical protein
MPTILELGPYRFFFYANDINEPATFMFSGIDIEPNSGQNRSDYNRVAVLVEKI